MNVAHVTQVKNINIVVVLYNKKNNTDIHETNKIVPIKNFLLFETFSNKILKLLLCKDRLLLVSIFDEKPLSLPIWRNLFFLCKIISSLLKFSKYSKFCLRDLLTFSKVFSLSLWAPPIGSSIISSTIFNSNNSFDVSLLPLLLLKFF